MRIHANPNAGNDIRLPSETVAQGLCTRCGYCLGACSQGLIEHDDELFPCISPDNLERCIQCAMCIHGCAAEIDLPHMNKRLFGQAPDPLDSIGILQNLFIGYAMDPAIRYASSSGGVLTALLVDMMENGIIDQALVCGANEDRPWEPKPMLAQTKTEILDSAQSKYNIVPQLSQIGTLLNSEKTTAIVGLPCHLHGFRKLEQRFRKLSGKVPLVIGLACNCTLEKEATNKLLEINNIPVDQVVKFEYRGGTDRWGNIRVKLSNGDTRNLHPLPNFKEAFKYLSLIYAPKRCLTCIDFSAELSDITVLDPNIRDSNGCYIAPEKNSMVMVRSSRGRAIIDSAISNRTVVLDQISAEYLPSQFRAAVKKKKIDAPIRIEMLKKKNMPYPDYNTNFPSPNTKDRLYSKFESLKRIFSNSTGGKDLFMRFAFSRMGIYLSRSINALKGRAP